MIRSFRDGETEKVWQQQLSRALPRNIQSRALMKLQQLNAAADLRDLRIPLSGARKHQWSIRINDQWRICFEWPKGGNGPVNVEIADYH
jgi:proteic killer suppression protein